MKKKKWLVVLFFLLVFLFGYKSEVKAREEECPDGTYLCNRAGKCCAIKAPPAATRAPREPDPPTPIPPAPTATPLPPTATPRPPTATPRPPTATPQPPTAINAVSVVGPNSPGTVVDEKTVGVGTVEWQKLDHAQVSDNEYATATVDNPAGTGGTKDKSVKLIKGNIISGTEKADTSTEWSSTDVYVSYGSSSDLWGLALTPTDINASDFGLAFSAIGTNSNDNAHTTRYIKATNFGFSIPAGATINGVLAEVEKKKDIGATQWANKGLIGVDHIRITVYYTSFQTVSCISLSRDVMSPVVGQSVTVTCQGSFSSSVTSPVARFRVSIDNGTSVTSGTVPLSPAGASYTATVPQPGAYVVQCQICTDSTAANCTNWGEPCQQSYTVGTSTATPPPGCSCNPADACTSSCVFDKFTPPITYTDPIKCSLPDSLFSTVPSAANKTAWCQANKRTKGDANSDGVINPADYFYYVAAKAGAKIPPIVNPDFDGSGTIDDNDRTIIIKSLKLL